MHSRLPVGRDGAGGQRQVTIIERHSDPSAIAGWGRLADAGSFYLGADWLRFVDSETGAEPSYLTLLQNGETAAGLVAHWNPGEGNPEYQATETLGLQEGAEPLLLLGGRRGYRSDVLLPEGSDATEDTDNLAALLSAATQSVPESHGRWWWPYLPTEAADRVVAAARVAAPGEAPGIRLLRADCAVEAVGAGVGDFIDALSTKQRRTNARRELRRFAESGLEVRQLRLSEIWEQAAPLLGQVQRKYGHDMSDERLRGFLGRQVEHLDQVSVVFAAFDGGRLVAFSLCYKSSSELALRLVGFDYPRLPGADEYAQLMLYAPLQYCYEHGLTRLHLGTESYEAKCRRGARIRPLWAVTSHLQTSAAAADERLSAVAERLPSHEAVSLTAEVRASLAAWGASSDSRGDSRS